MSQAAAAAPPRVSALEVTGTSLGYLVGSPQVLLLAFLVSTVSAMASVLFQPLIMTVLRDYTDVPVPYRFDMPIAVGMAVAGLMVGCLSLIPMMTLSRVVFEKLLGGEIGALAAASEIIGRFFPMLGMMVVSSICVGFGLVLLMIPGLILSAMWLVPGPACIFEELGPFDSLTRSQELTRGNRVRLFLLFFLPTLLFTATSGLVSEAILQSMGRTIGVISEMVLGTVCFGYMVTYVTVAYVRLASARLDDDQA